MMNDIQSAKWQGPERDIVRVIYLDAAGKTQACFVPNDTGNGDWRKLCSWVDAGGTIEDPDE